MHPAIESLMVEHRLIEHVLGSLLTFAGDISPQDRPTVARFSDFIRLFADKCHHGKEEDRLFARMAEHGFPRDTGPIAVMLAEHDQGRAHASVLAEIGAGNGPMTEDELDAVADNAEQFVALLRDHIKKEDNILYPMALRALPAQQLQQLVEQYEAFERDVIGPDEHRRLHTLAHELATQYPPRVERDLDFCAGCHH